MKPTARTLHLFAVVCFSLMQAPCLTAQEVPSNEPTAEHQWLGKFVGSWETTSTAAAEAGQGGAPMKGTIDSKMVGKYWLETSMTADIGGFSMLGRQTIGYSKKKGTYVGTWIDNTSDHMWQYTGAVDKSGKVLSLEAIGPDMSDPSKTALYRDMYEFVSKDEIKLTSSVQDAAGEWTDFMTGVAKRKQ